MNYGVSAEQLAKVSIDIKNIRYLTSLAFVRSDGVPALVVSFFADYHNGNIKLCEDLSEYAWVSLEQAKKYNFISGIYEELEMLDKILKGENAKEWGK